MSQTAVTLESFATLLSAHPEAGLHLTLPDGTSVPAHFHVTEVGRVRKDFIDCGGTVRRLESCVLQAWVASDVEHRLHAAKVTKILEQSASLFDTRAIPLEIDYDAGVLSRYAVQSARPTSDGIVLQLVAVHAECLAPDRCGVPLVVLSSCTTPGCC